MRQLLPDLKSIVIFTIALFGFAPLAHAVDCEAIPDPPQVTIDSIHTFNFSGFGGSDCWGWEGPDGTEYAIMGVADGVAFVNVTTLQVVQTVPGPLNGCGSVRWRDMETYGNYCYCVSECSGTNGGMMIIDMSYLPDSVHFVGSYNTGTSHNMFVDTERGFAYVLLSGASGFRVLDLSDPENPVATPTVSTLDIHDLYARRDTVWVAEGNRGTWSMWNMADKQNPQLIVRVPVPNAGYVHNIWPTDNSDYVVTTEETAFKTIKIWDISDVGNVQLISEYIAPSQLAHNAHIIGDYVVTSHYESGLYITDISTPECPAQVGQFDTWTPSETPNFNGAWGAYPYTSSGNIYISNDNGRLFIVNADLSLVKFDAVPSVGEAPLMVAFEDLSAKQSTGWHWDFGDGDTSALEAPSHTYSDGGLYDVELTVTNVDGTSSKLRKNFVTVLADTMGAPDTGLTANTPAYIEIRGRNAVPITEFVLPITMTNVTSVVFLDSISFVGTRTEYFESHQVVFDNRFFGQLAIKSTANVGGGSPPLPPGDGPIARIYIRTRFNATPGQTSVISVGHLGTYDFEATTLSTDFVPVFNDATITIQDESCLCGSHGDVVDNGFYDSIDLAFLIDHLYAGGAQPPQDPICPHIDRGDLNCDGFDTSLDLSYMIDLLFAGGADPCDPCACNSYPDDCP